MTNENDWFLPKRFGYGAGMPISWQGWALTMGFSLVTIVAALLLIPAHIGAFVAIALIGGLAITVIAAQHTRGGWKWRWGGEE